MNELRLSYIPDDHWMGKLMVSLRSGRFAGYGEAWVSLEQIAEFAEALESYPLLPNPPATLEGGHGGSLDGRVKPQTLVKVVVKPHGGRGAVLVSARLEDEIDSHVSRDASLFQGVEARFLTGYAELAPFVAQLKALGTPEARDAVLRGGDWT